MARARRHLPVKAHKNYCRLGTMILRSRVTIHREQYAGGFAKSREAIQKSERDVVFRNLLPFQLLYGRRG
jgi:hypothetical protein